MESWENSQQSPLLTAGQNLEGGRKPGLPDAQIRDMESKNKKHQSQR